MKNANSIVAVVLVIVLGVGPVLAFARATEGTRSSGLSSRRMRPAGKPRAKAPRLLQTPTLTDGQTSTTLPDGGLLIAGGLDQVGPTHSLKIFNPRTGKSKSLPDMAQARAYHSATILPDGRVFVFGGVGKNQRVLSTGTIVDPDTGESKDVPARSGLSSRTNHTATLLTDGRVLIVGGRTEGDRLIDVAQVWDYRMLTATSVGTLSLAREKHTATLLADGNVLIEGGVDETGAEAEAAELFNVEAKTFSFTTMSSAESERGIPFLSASIPADGAAEVPVDINVALRFSQRLSPEAIKQAIKFETVQEGVAVKIVPAEQGRLVFINPLEDLRKGTPYQASVVAPADGSLNITSASVSFTTVAENIPINRGSADLDWAPDADSLRGNWQTKMGRSSWEDQSPLEAQPGQTALAGTVLTLTGQPLSDVTISVNSSSTRTDHTGRFLLNAQAGRFVMLIDGRTANRPGRTYGIFRTRVDIKEGQTNVLDYTIWMPKLDMAQAVTIPSPNSRDIVITNPAIPGLELHLPAGTVIRDLDGKTVTQLSITPIPTDRPPFPLPPGLKVPVFASIQPGGSQVIPPRARLIYPNYNNETPGTRINFWNYDPQDKGWYIYGQGTVTADGKQIVPDPGVVIYEFSGIMISNGGFPPWLWPEAGDDDEDGDPVDLSTGLFVLEKTDLAVPDTIPISLTRSYRPGDTTSRPFGIGSSHPYEMFLYSDNNWQEADLILPDGGRIHYNRVSPGTSYLDAVFEHTSSPSVFYKSQIIRNDDAGWDVRLLDGTVFVFPDVSPLQSIRDRYGNKITITRTNGVLGSITQLTSPNGRWIQFTYGSGGRVSQARDNSGRTVNYTYDSSNRLWKVTDPEGGVTEYIYDSSHRMLTIKDARGITYLTNEYDSNGKVISQTLADDSTYEFDYTLNGSGKVTETEVTDPRGNVRRVTFNSSGYTLTDTGAEGTSAEQTITFERQSGSNHILSITDQLNRETSYTYDSYGGILTITRLTGTEDATTRTFTYEPNFHQLASITDELSHTTSYGYDNQGNLTSITDPLSHQTTFAYNSAGQITSMTDALNKTTSWTYDSGDVASQTNPLGHTFSRVVDALGRPIVITDPLGGITTFEYDGLNQPIQMTDARGGITSFSYDENGNVLTITDPNDHTTSYSYDDMDRLETRTDPLLRSESYEYDENGNLTKITDRRSKVTTYTYDALNRQNFAGFGTVVSGGSTTYESTISYTYDAVSRLEEVVDSASGTITLDYDGLDRLTSETTPQGTVSYAYDDVGRQTSMTVTGRSAVNYTYDNADRLTGITQGTTSVTYAYDAANRRTSLTLPNGLVTEYGYDDGSNLTSITYKQGSTVLGDLTYEYDALKNRTKMGGSYARTGLPQAFSSATYNAANQMTQRASTTLSYDNNGNLTNDGVNTYSWDARNQLTAISGGVSASFEYDSFGRRVSKTVTSQTTDYLYDGVDVVQELSGSATADMLNGATTDERLSCNCDGASRTLLSDALSSTLALTNSSGSVQTEYTYEPFGATATSGTTSSNASQYTGRENDSTGLQYYRARYYSPLLQRFISEDPSEFQGGDTNLYAYVGNSPTNFTDPSGEIPPLVGACVGGAAFNVGWDLLSGRKPTWQSAVSGCIGGMIGFGAFRALRPLLRGLKPRFPRRTPPRGVRPQGKSCFTAGTEIATAEGEKPIEEIEVGDLVWAYDERTGETALRRVARVFTHSTNLLVVLTVGDEVIETTLDHPFWVKDKGWVEGKDLRVGDTLQTLSGAALSITSIEYVPGNVAVYNFEVEGFHTYFVSGMQVLVHNKAMRRKPGKRGERKGTDALRRENKVVRDVVKELGLDKDQQRRLHDELYGEDLTYHEILELARTLFNK